MLSVFFLSSSSAFLQGGGMFGESLQQQVIKEGTATLTSFQTISHLSLGAAPPPHAPCNMFYPVPMLIGCWSVLAIRCFWGGVCPRFPSSGTGPNVLPLIATKCIAYLTDKALLESGVQ